MGELPLSTQARLLRVLETGEYIKVGSSKVQKTDVRIVAATNVDFAEAIAEGRFREDLYYRLNTVPIKVPPLRERPDDIVLLFRKFASDFAEKYRMPAIQLAEDAKQMLVAYPWPGNIRQLKNITEQISIIETNRDISAEILNNYLPARTEPQFPALLGVRPGEKKFESEREILYQVLFDMRRDVTELKKYVYEGVRSSRQEVATPTPGGGTLTVYGHGHPAVSLGHPLGGEPIQEAEEVTAPTSEEAEAQSLDDLERDVIRRALERHKGRRKAAAAELGISERTLYRKIKEYDLE